MKLVTISGPPSSGKTAVLVNVIKSLKASALRTGAVKYDCLATEMRHRLFIWYSSADGAFRQSFALTTILSAILRSVWKWGISLNLDLLGFRKAPASETVAPRISREYLRSVSLKIPWGSPLRKRSGPCLKFADIVVITKGDIVSQAEVKFLLFRYVVQMRKPESCM